MNLLRQKPSFFYIATLAFLALEVVAVLVQQWWLMLLPVFLLFCIWTFEKVHLLFYLLLATIPWSIEYQFSETLGTDFPDEPLMWLNAAMAVFFITYTYKNIGRTNVLHPFVWLLLLQLSWTALTAVTSTYPLLSLKFLLAKSWYLLSFVLLPVLLITTRERLKTTALILTASMTVLVLVTMVRHAAAGFTFATINTSLAPFFRNHVNYSALLVCVIPLLVVFINATSKRATKTALRIFIILCLVALYLSYARGAWLALLTGAVAYGLLKKKLLLPAFFLALILTLASVFWLQHNDRYLAYAHNYNQTIFHTNFAEHLTATYELKDMSTAERFYRWIAGMRMVQDGWKTGFGPNTFYNNYKPYTVPAFKTWVSANEEHSTVHNYFLLLLIEQGIFGLLFFLALLALSFYKAQRIYHATADAFWKAAVAAVAVILVMICTVNFLSDLIETDKIGSLFYLCLAVLIIADNAVRKEASQPAAHVQRIA